MECEAVRRDRAWVVTAVKHSVYGHGRTLRKARENVEQGLALIGVTAPVTITVQTPEMEKLRAARAASDAALREAVEALALRRTTLRDIAEVTQTPTAEVKRLLADNLEDRNYDEREDPS